MEIDFPEDKEAVVQRMQQIIPRVFEHDLVVAGECFKQKAEVFILYSNMEKNRLKTTIVVKSQ